MAIQPSSGGMGGGTFFFILISILAFAWYASNQSGGGFLPSGDGPYTPLKVLPTDVPGIGFEVGRIGDELKRVQEEIAKAQSLAEQSNYAKTISFENSYGASAEEASREYLTIKIDERSPSSVGITGWTLKSPITGVSVAIPKAVRLPFLGLINTEDSVIAAPGDRIVVSTGRSPTGYSFRLNKCTGYFEQFQDFYPSLPLNCPLAEDEPRPLSPSNFNDACLDFLERIPQCTISVGSIPAEVDALCNRYIVQEINYGKCVERHKNNPDFYKREWRIYLGRSEELWKDRREVIKLLDASGKTIDAVSY